MSCTGMIVSDILIITNFRLFPTGGNQNYQHHINFVPSGESSFQIQKTILLMTPHVHPSFIEPMYHMIKLV